MKRTLLIAFALAVTGCGTGGRGAPEPTPQETTASSTTSSAPATTTTPTTVGATTTTTTTTTTTLPEEEPELAWSPADAERHVADFLAALAAGAYEQAAWSVVNNGIALSQGLGDESPADTFRRLCADGACAGPYAVVADGPGVVDPVTAQAASTVTVVHTATGEEGTIALATFEGQLIIADLPPLVPSTGGASLVEQLFGDSIPDRVVVRRFDAFEIWEDGTAEWVTNWWARDAYQVEGDVVAAHRVAASLRDPLTRYDGECPRLMSREGEVLVLDQCDTSGWNLFEATSGDPRRTPIDLGERGDGAYAWFTERAGTVVHGSGDAEGNLFPLQTLQGIDVLQGDYAGHVALSTDGALFAYVDHSDPAALSHFWSPVVAVRDTATGAEVGRWTLDNPVLCLEFAVEWLIACEAGPSREDLASGTPDQAALVAVNVATGEVNRVETRTRVFLPA